MQNLSQKTVGQIVTEDYRTARVFRSFGLDFCCGGGKPLQKACSKNNVDLKEVLSELANINNSDELTDNYNEWTPDFLADYIVNNHHQFVRKMLPEINFYAQKVARVHGRSHPELVEILQKVEHLNDELLEHLVNEEEELFPQIKEMVVSGKKGQVKQAVVEALEEDHEKAGELMAEIEELTNGFSPPEEACASYRVLFQNLEGFQEDLHKHVHLENNILFPKALAIEDQIG